MWHQFPLSTHRASWLAVAATLATFVGSAASAQTLVASRDTAVPAQATPGVRTVSDDALAAARQERTWHGTIGGKDGGRVTMTIDRIGIPDDVMHPVWPVVTFWRIEANDPSKSFSAELFGNGYENGSMQLRGIITEGYRKGSEVNINLQGGGKGTVSVRIGT
jgi:hypothetical protein